MKKLRVTIEGKAYEVLVEMIDEGAPVAAAAPTPAVAAPVAAASVAAPVAAPARPAPAAAGAGDVGSPLAGKVVSIDVKVGDAVDESTQVATVEAMKMNTYVYAPRAGRVAAIVANAGDGVEEGGVLLRLA